MAIEIDEQEPPGEGYMYSLETESFFQQSPEREREEEEEDNEGERQAVVEGEAAVQNWDQEFDQPVWSENLTVESERMRGHYPQEQQDVDPLAIFFLALFLYLCRNNPRRLMELD
ncbi:uncharacterized protein [Porites lutea]|uniref:uncharacterized protein n=1 Tax=Porites lutea TaxID=51062 RepID=UPI003CC656C2